MGDVAVAASLAPCQTIALFSRVKWSEKLQKQERQQRKSQPVLVINNQMSVKPATYSSRIATDIPLYEAPGASLDEYLKDKSRVFKAIFPDKRRSQQLSEELWRIQMLPIQFLFLTVWPVVDMKLKCKSRGEDYPPGVPQDITKVLELDIVSNMKETYY